MRKAVLRVDFGQRPKRAQYFLVSEHRRTIEYAAFDPIDGLENTADLLRSRGGLVTEILQYPASKLATWHHSQNDISRKEQTFAEAARTIPLLRTLRKANAPGCHARCYSRTAYQLAVLSRATWLTIEQGR